MNVRSTLVLLLAGTVVVSAPRLDASERLRVRASGNPEIVRIYVGINPHADDRMIRVTAESEDFFRRSEVQLDGEASPRVRVFTFMQLPSGWYDVTVQLFTDNPKAAETSKTTVLVP